MTFSPDALTVEQINAQLVPWRQGDVVDVAFQAWFAQPIAPLTPQAAQSDGDELSCVVSKAEPMAIISQTCDVVRGAATRPFLLLARVVRLGEPAAGEARRGSRPRFVPLPGLGEDAFVDLDQVSRVEKSVVLDVEPIRGLPDVQAQRRFGQGVARAFSRFAFPDDLAVSLRGLVARVRDKHARESPEGRALLTLEEIRVTGLPSWDADEIDVFVTFAPASREDAEGVMDDEQWDGVIDGWLRRTEPFGVIRSVEGAMVPLDELTAREYLDSDALDLDYLSWQTQAPDRSS